jgi:hypothetical protein
MNHTEGRKLTAAFLPLALRGVIESLARRDKVSVSEEVRRLLATAVGHELLRDGDVG